MGALLLQVVPAQAAEGGPPAMMGRAERGDGVDWIGHTQHTLDELKSKLNLAPGQQAAWASWSGGVLKDAHDQLEQRSQKREAVDEAGSANADITTPERMARGIERLRAENAWMQQHLVQLEAAQQRTKAFYEQLDTNQKTIFDLFWHEVHHRVSGHDDGRCMHAPCGQGWRATHGDPDDADSAY
jgi:hypothetical protein